MAFTLALSVLTCAVLAAAQAGWADPRVIGGLAVAGLLFAVFAHIERRGPAPLLDLSLLRYRRFLGIQLLAAAPAYAFVVLLVLLPMRFAGIEGMGAGRAGWMMAALSAPLLVLPLAAGRLARRWPPAVLCGVGLLACAAGLLWLAARTGLQVLPAMVVIGAGISLPWGLMDGLAVSVVPPERAGMAAGIFSTTRVAGEGVALAVVGSVLAGLIQARLPGAAEGLPVAQLLGAGRLEDAMALVPAVAPHMLVEAYEAAFARLAQGLAVVTAVTALAVWACLGRGGLRQEGSAPAEGRRKTGAGEGNRTLV
ncbi:MFS transporter [Paracidovorax avenae]|uniref:MFS transporter n=1 Tax=Paracidovorax avenae TaxID=80867 RepID=UPI00336A10D8